MMIWGCNWWWHNEHERDHVDDAHVNDGNGDGGDDALCDGTWFDDDGVCGGDDDNDNDGIGADDEITTMTDFLIRFMNCFLNMP